MQLLIKRLKANGTKIILWSGAGAEEAKAMAEKMNLTEYIDEYRDKQIYEGEDQPDFAFDDDKFALFLAKNPTILV